jgi:hypothetical protein
VYPEAATAVVTPAHGRELVDGALRIVAEAVREPFAVPMPTRVRDRALSSR